MTKTQGTLDALVERYFGETTDVQALSLETAALVHPIAYRAACGMNLDGPDAEEVAQEVATKFVKRLESGERPRGNPEALLWRMAENRSRDVHRARKRQTQGKQRLGLELTATADVAPDAETVWLTRERQVRVEEIVREVLKEAPASYQNAIRSHYLEGVPVEELANANYAELVVAGEVDERDPASVREAERRARNRADQHLKRGRDWLRMRLHEQLREGAE
ncbi:MAG: sigma-70 family RNA polymerase sigma factor [Polyangiaceae bacterium]|nr:sigma-70 family RNA polymerase sigma factor [Polyangiaceae bacterium]MCB9629742.1 sigma-70 family RNA polymerase sigma factor [Sandaracinaceae bacterium]